MKWYLNRREAKESRFYVRSLSIATSDPKTVHTPTDQERQTLEATTREAVGRVAMRAQTILLSARGYSAPRIAEIQEIAKGTVYKWIDRVDGEVLRGSTTKIVRVAPWLA